MIFVFPTYFSIKYMEIPIYYVSDCIYKKMNIYVTPHAKFVWIFNVIHWPLSLYLRVVLDPSLPNWGNWFCFRKIGLHQFCALMDPGLHVTKQKESQLLCNKQVNTWLFKQRIIYFSWGASEHTQECPISWPCYTTPPLTIAPGCLNNILKDLFKQTYATLLNLFNAN